MASPPTLASVATRREWLTAAVLALGLMALLSAPYLLGHFLAPPGTFYTGIIMNPEDTQSYFAKMAQGFDGRWLYMIPFTTEPHPPAFVGGFYLALGHFARLAHLPLESTWHLARFVAGVIVLLATFLVIATHLPGRRARWTAYFMAVLGSGLGWLLFLVGQPNWLGWFPVDFKMPEAHLFFSALAFPHVALGTAAMLFGLWCLLRSASGGPRSWLYAGLGGLSNLALGVLYPFLIFVVALAAAMFWLWLVARRHLPWSSLLRPALAFAIAAPLFVYYAYVERTNIAFRAWAEQAATASPPLAHYFVAYGPYLLLALPLLWRPWARETVRWAALPVAWLAAAAMFLYGPFNAQRRYVQGIQVPLAILAAAGLMAVIVPTLQRTRAVRWLLRRPRYTAAGLERLAIVAVIAVLSISNIYLLADVSMTAALRQPYPFFRLQEEREAAAWLNGAAPAGATVLAGPETGNYLGAWTGSRVFIGHWAETMAYDAKRLAAARFYSASESDAWRRALLEAYGLKFVWHGPEERQLGGFRPGETSYLTAVYTGREVTIFRVR
jgi:hypothetical protein